MPYQGGRPWWHGRGGPLGSPMMVSHELSLRQGLTVACPGGPVTCLVEEIPMGGWRTAGSPGTSVIVMDPQSCPEQGGLPAHRTLAMLVLVPGHTPEYLGFPGAGSHQGSGSHRTHPYDRGSTPGPLPLR